MAYDEGLASLMRDDLDSQVGLSEKKMFGGLCFLLHGHMLCGVSKDGAMFRVGKPRYEQALALAGISPLSFTGRPMGGMVEADDAVMADDQRRHQMLELALTNARSLPAK